MYIFCEPGVGGCISQLEARLLAVDVRLCFRLVACMVCTLICCGFENPRGFDLDALVDLSVDLPMSRTLPP